MSIEKPNPRDFGVTQEQYDLYARGKLDKRSSGLIVVCSRVVAFLAIVLAIVALFRESWVLSLEMLVPLFLAATVALVLGSLLAMSTEAIVVQLRRYRLRKMPVASQIKLYKEAEEKYYVALREARTAQLEAERAWWEAEQVRRRKIREYWMSLSGIEFERELGILYKNLGYRVESTPRSGDQGIDLILRKDGKTTVVQCKSHQSPVGPAVARELLGSLVASHADNAILACTGGFTQGVEEFVRDKPITLISAQELTTLADSFELVPVCPMPGCGKVMVLQTGGREGFWECPEYPRCRGRRDGWPV